MYLTKLELSNFRCFGSLSMDLDRQLTVLVAKNGQGKTAVLDAIRIGLWAFVGGFDLARNPPNDAGNNISIDDVRMRKALNDYKEMERCLPCKITLHGMVDYGDLIEMSHTIDNPNIDSLSENGDITWSRLRDSEAKGSKTKDDKNSKEVRSRANHLVVMNLEAAYNFPVVGYYGTGRLWSQKRLTENKKTTDKVDFDVYMRLFAYRDCLDSASSYKHFADWFTWAFECYREDQIKHAEKGLATELDSVWLNIIKVVQQTIDLVLQKTGWHTLEYSVSNEKSLILHHDEQGILKVESLSDGIRGVLAMVGDITYRCIKLNPHLGINAAKEASGIVMIDEIDMHLHPAWQQTILGDLTNTFPNIQFIVTTHSPQVLSTVPSQQIRIVDEGQTYAAEAGTQGAEASRILKRIFGVDPRPQNDPNTKKLNEYLDLVYSDKWQSTKAIDMRVGLDAIYQDNEPALTEADLYIENRQWELDIEKNQ